MYRGELIGLEEKVKEIAEQIEGAAEKHAGAWSIKRRAPESEQQNGSCSLFDGHRIEKRICKL